MQPYVARGWEVYGISPPGPRIEGLLEAGIHWLPHDIPRRLSVRGDAIGCRALFRHFRQHRFHIVHGHNVKTGILARVIAAAARTPVIVQTHHGLIYHLDSEPVLRYGGTALERFASAASDRSFVQSEDDFRTLIESGGARRTSLALIGNGVDLRLFDPQRFDEDARGGIRRDLGIALDDVVFFSAGRLVREKGFLELFEATERARRENPKVRLVVAGPMDTGRSLELDEATLERAREQGVILLGERSDMARLYAASDVVVLASWREGIARVLMEGAVMGKPLIASDARGCGLVVKPGWGFLTRMRDADALAEKILVLAGDAALRRRIGEHNAEAGRREYDLARVLQRIDDTYTELLQKKGIPVDASSS